MANLPNFLGAPLIDSGLSDVAGDLSRGMQARALPGQLQRSAQQEQLANALMQAKMPYIQPQMEAELQKSNLENVLRQREVDYPGLSARDPLVQALALSEYYGGGAQPDGSVGEQSGASFETMPQKDGSSLSEMADYAKRALDDRFTQMQRHQQIVKSNLWSNTPREEQMRQIGIAQSLGVSPSDFIRDAVNLGQGLEEQMLDKKGITPEQLQAIVPTYLPSGAVVSEQKRRDFMRSAINSVENEVIDAMAPYARRFYGFSLKQIGESLKGENADEQAKYLAALAMQDELANMRVAMAGGASTQGAIENMVRKSLGKATTLNEFVSPEVYKKTQKQLNEWLNKMSDAGRDEIYGVRQAGGGAFNVNNIDGQRIADPYQGMDLYYDENNNPVWLPKEQK